MDQIESTIENKYKQYLKMIGENVRHFRKMRFGNQDNLSLKVGINVCTISHIEGGQGNPRIETLFYLANAFGVDPIELLRRQEKDSPNTQQDFLNIPGYGELNDEQKSMVRDVAILMTNRLSGEILHISQEKS